MGEQRILQYAAVMRQNLKWTPEERQQIQRDCVHQGFYTIGTFFSPQENTPTVVALPHGYPDAFEKEPYMHRHDFFELVYVYRGGFISRMEKETIHLHEGEFLLISPGMLHAPMIESREDFVFNILFNVPFMQMLLSCDKSADFLLKYFSAYLCGTMESNCYLYFHGISEETRQKAELLIDEFATNKTCTQNIVQSLMAALLFSLMREYDGRLSIQDSSRVTEPEILSFIQNNYATVTLRQTADKFSYSPPYLSRLIHQVTGKSFSELVKGHRLTEAKRLLTETTLTVEEIAWAVGVQNMASFSRFFQQNLSKSPSQYRKDLTPAVEYGQNWQSNR